MDLSYNVPIFSLGEDAEKLKYKAKRYLKDTLKLELSEEKTLITNVKSKPIKFLGVEMSDIAQYGAVSEQVAMAMAQGAKAISHSDFAISTTGIAGPTGGSKEKPVGTVWIGIATPDKCYAVLKNCGTDRSQIISRATAYAIAMLYDELKIE